jgi:hypothetical protein
MRTRGIAALVLAGIAVFALRVVAAQTSVPTDRVLRLSFHDDGTVTLVATNVTPREILNEWARLGGSRVVNAEQLRGGPITVQFENRPQIEVLQSVLRSAAGIILGPRRAGGPGASSFESVYILVSSSPTTSSAFASPTSPQQVQVATPGSPDDEIPPVVPGALGQPGAPGEEPTQPTRPPTTYVPGSGVFVPIVPVPPTTGRGGATPPASGSAGSGSLD